MPVKYRGRIYVPHLGSVISRSADNQLQSYGAKKRNVTNYQVWHINQATIIILKSIVEFAAENQLHQLSSADKIQLKHDEN